LTDGEYLRLKSSKIQANAGITVIRSVWWGGKSLTPKLN